MSLERDPQRQELQHQDRQPLQQSPQDQHLVLQLHDSPHLTFARSRLLRARQPLSKLYPGPNRLRPRQGKSPQVQGSLTLAQDKVVQSLLLPEQLPQGLLLQQWFGPRV